MGINLLTFNQKTIAPKDDALIQQYALGQDGFFYGGTPTYTGGNTIHFQSGEGMMCGREFVLEDTDVSAALPASGTLLGQVYIHIDLSNTDNPIELVCETAETLTELTKDENLNVNNGTYDLQLCTFTANVSNITDLVSQIKQIKKGGGGSDENLAQIEDGTEATRAYVAGEFVVVDGLLRKVLAPIAIGDEFEDDVNEEITNVGAQISAINQNLTCRYNNGYIQYFDGSDWINWIAPQGTTLAKLIPTLTSNTSASETVGNVTATTSGTQSAQYAFHAFDDTDLYKNYVALDGSQIIFTFNTSTLVNILKCYVASSNGASMTAYLDVTTDGTNWTNVKTFSTSSTNWQNMEVEINSIIKAFRIRGGNGNVALLKTYGLNAFIKQ